LFPNWKPFTQKFNFEGVAFVFTGVDGLGVAVPIDVRQVFIWQKMSLLYIPQELALPPFGAEFPTVLTWDELILDN
jgi:hypothetical protein